MKDSARNYFQNLFTKDCSWRLKLDNCLFNRLDEAAVSLLEAEFSKIEVYDCLMGCEGDKAPGPDGFNMKFFQLFWGVVKKDIMDFFMDFHKNSSFVKSLNATFMLLIPKRKNASNIKDFHPMSLVGCVYKLFSKVFASTLSKVLESIIGENQQPFVHGRQISDAILMANEVVDDVIRNKKVASNVS